MALSASEIYAEAFGQGLRPDPRLSVSTWADRHRVLSQIASAEPGRWRTSRTPYLREIMDCLSPASPVERVVFMKGSQTGGTEGGMCFIGYVIHQAPGPMLVVQPTVEMGKRWSKGRFAPLIEDTPVLRERVKDPRSRDSGNTVQSKEFPGGIVVVTGANSAVGLRSMPVRYLFLDEIDAYPGDADGEGDPVSLAIQRTLTFSRRKILMVSTPTIAGLSRIELEYEASDRRRYHVPCPECGHKQVLVWAQVKWTDLGLPPEEARYECIGCGTAIPNHRKTWMLENGEWIAEAPGPGKAAGFHLSGLYSPVGWFSWGDAAKSFLAAKDNDHLLKVWVNTVLGETWTEKGDAPEWRRLYDRREDYPIGTVSDDAVLLTAGADVQRDRIEVSLWAWGPDKQSWLVEHRVLTGDTSRPEVWDALTAMLDETWPASESRMRIARLAIDSGYATQEVYGWVRKQPRDRVMAVKGTDGFNKSVPVSGPTYVDATDKGRKLRRGAAVWTVCSAVFKSELYGWLRLERPTDESAEPFPPGFVHLPKVDEEYLKQLTAERLVERKDRRGFRRLEWEKTRERNEALDARVYARAAAWLERLDAMDSRAMIRRAARHRVAEAPPAIPIPARIAAVNQTPPPGGVAVSGVRRREWLDRRRGWLR